MIAAPRTSIAARTVLQKVALLAYLACCFSLRAAEPAGTHDVAALMEKGDRHDGRLEASEALACYREVEKQLPNDADLLVRIARQYRHLMADARGEEEKLKLGRTAIAYSEKAAQLGPRNAEAQLAPAISYGKLVELLSSREQVQASAIIKACSERAVKLDAGNDLAWHILGRWHRVMADTSGVKRAMAGLLFGTLEKGSIDEALRCLHKAAALAPARLMHEYELGRAYLVKGDEPQARLHFQKAASMRCTDKGDAEAVAEAQAALAKL